MSGRIQSSPPYRTPPPVPPRMTRFTPGPDIVLTTIENGRGTVSPTLSSAPAPSPGRPVPPPAACESDEDVWGSDLDDVQYTPEEQREFDERFAREEIQIANAQRNWHPRTGAPPQAHDDAALP